MMRVWVYVALFFLVLVAPFLVRATMKSDGLPQAPSGQGDAARLVVVTPHNQDIRREFARAFAEWHVANHGQPVVVEYLMPGGTNDIKRLLEATYKGYRDEKGALPDVLPINMDVVWGGGDFFFEVELNRELGVLQPIDVPATLLEESFPSPTLAGVKLREVSEDEQGNVLPPKWVGACLSSFGIVYNPELYRSLGLDEPKAWYDLTNPQLSGLVALADPTRSGSAAVAYMMVVQRAMADAEEAFIAADPVRKEMPLNELQKQPGYNEAIATGWHAGMGWLQLIAANARYFTDSANLVPKDVSTGDAAAGMAIDFYGRTYQEVVGENRVRFISPTAATAITPDPVGILKGVSGERRALANRFVEFLLTKQGQLLWVTKAGAPGGPKDRGLRRPPVRADLYADRSNWSDDVNPFEEAGNFNQRQEWMALFGDMRPVWAAAWMDAREDMKRCYAQILKVEDPARRATLLAQFADVPVRMADVVKDRDARKALAKERPDAVAYEAAKTRMRWAAVFRDHYERLIDQSEAGAE